MQSVREHFEKDHDRLDGLLGAFQRMKLADFPEAKTNFKGFLFGLTRHIRWEEEVLFPLFERKTGMHDSGPTEVMRQEHVLIKERLDILHAKVRAGNPDCDLEVAALIDVLKAHNIKEERILYPAIDHGLEAGELAAVEKALEAIPEQTSCGCGHAHAH